MGIGMARAPYNVLVFPYRLDDQNVEYAIFNRSDSKEDFWQGISGGGEYSESPVEAAIGETWEVSRLSKDSEYVQLDSVFSVPANIFGDGCLWGKDVYVILNYCFGAFAANQARCNLQLKPVR